MEKQVTNLKANLARYKRLYSLIGYGGEDFSPCDEIRFYHSSEDMLKDLQQATALLEKAREALNKFSPITSRTDDDYITRHRLLGELASHGIGGE